MILPPPQKKNPPSPQAINNDQSLKNVEFVAEDNDLI